MIIAISQVKKFTLLHGTREAISSRKKEKEFQRIGYTFEATGDLSPMRNGNAKIARMPEGRSCDVLLNTAYPLEIALRLACPVNFSQERETVTPLRHAQGERDFIDSRYLNGRRGAAEQARKSLAARTRSWRAVSPRRKFNGTDDSSPFCKRRGSRAEESRIWNGISFFSFFLYCTITSWSLFWNCFRIREGRWRELEFFEQFYLGWMVITDNGCISGRNLGNCGG